MKRQPWNEVSTRPSTTTASGMATQPTMKSATARQTMRPLHLKLIQTETERRIQISTHPPYTDTTSTPTTRQSTPPHPRTARSPSPTSSACHNDPLAATPPPITQQPVTPSSSTITSAPDASQMASSSSSSSFTREVLEGLRGDGVRNLTEMLASGREERGAVGEADLDRSSLLSNNTRSGRGPQTRRFHCERADGRHGPWTVG
ncbi:hypothetical protein EYF80_013294 [Liparis tanakae]|uniref:Uncharacterized protein n=1 Tax=Liparis tanakae TaxID=230148 RepID=A0A4Z2IE99_9TELE|nr:hypothetical protein EYF80_013294 [Liparis tanakae]